MQVMFWPMLSHQNPVLSISTRMSSGLRGCTMALICVLWLPMRSATPLAWVTPSLEARWWLRSTPVINATSGCIWTISKAYSPCMVSARRRPGSAVTCSVAHLLLSKRCGQMSKTACLAYCENWNPYPKAMITNLFTFLYSVLNTKKKKCQRGYKTS